MHVNRVHAITKDQKVDQKDVLNRWFDYRRTISTSGEMPPIKKNMEGTEII